MVSILSDRQAVQMVLLGENHSAPWPLTCGVTKSQCYRLCLLAMYMKPLVEVVSRYRIGRHHYVESTQLLLSLSSYLKD